MEAIMKHQIFSIRLPKDLLDQLRQIAKEDGRATGNLIHKILRDYLKAKAPK